MRPTIDEIEIKDPPLEELTGRGACLRRSCGTCSGLILTILIASILTLKFTAPPKAITIKKIPDTVAAVPLYDTDSIEKIELTSGKERSRGVEMIAFIPKLILSPLIIGFDKPQYVLKTFRPDLIEAINQKKTFWDKLMVLLREPVGDHRDVVVITWKHLATDPQFINEYYTKTLTQKGFAIKSESASPTIHQFTFSKDGIDGAVYIADQPETPTTDEVTVTITPL